MEERHTRRNQQSPGLVSVKTVFARHYRDPNCRQTNINEEEGGEGAHEKDGEHCRSGAESATARILQNCGSLGEERRRAGCWR